MAVTLEELAKRVEALEARASSVRDWLPPGAIPLKPPYYYFPPKGNMADILEPLKGVHIDFDYDALKEQDAVDIEHERQEAEKWRDSR